MVGVWFLLVRLKSICLVEKKLEFVDEVVVVIMMKLMIDVVVVSLVRENIVINGDLLLVNCCYGMMVRIVSRVLM